MSEPKHLANFRKALAKLGEFTALPVKNDRDRAGIIQAFEFSFEICWKCFQKTGFAEGLEASSPRQSLAVALQLKFIRAQDERAWLGMLEDRSLTSHLDHEELAREIAKRVMETYLPLLKDASKRLSEPGTK